MGKYNVDTFDSGEALRRVREHLNLTDGQIAIKVGDKTGNVENYMKRGFKNIDKYLDWCDKLDCDIDFLLGVQELPKKDVANVCETTGLDEATVELLKKEIKNPPTAEARNNSDAVVSGIKTADIFNDLAGFRGSNLKDSMHQYVRERMVCDRLDESIDNIVAHKNQEAQIFSKDSVITLANNILTSVRMMTSLSSLTMTGRQQKKIDDDFTAFYKRMSKEQFSKEECRMIFDYLQSRNRTDALKMNCYEQLVWYLDTIAEDNKLMFHKQGWGDFEVFATKMYEEPIDTIEEARSEMLTSAVKRELIKLRLDIRESKTAQKNLIETNNKLSAELSDERKKVKELQSILDHLPEDDRSLTLANKEIDTLRGTARSLLEANQGLSHQVDKLQKELKELKSGDK